MGSVSDVDVTAACGCGYVGNEDEYVGRPLYCAQFEIGEGRCFG